jgi:histidyl-tRNA synthetase
MDEIIQPKVLKGFRDMLPPAEMVRSSLTEKLSAVFRAYGFVPIDTPSLEYAEILLRKSGGETEKQVFRFTDNGGRDVALRFDLTVPFARFTAEHFAELYFPFKRYHIAKVWRGEKPQAGRYREFIQCDFDIVGSESPSSDFEILLLMKAAFTALGIDGIAIHLNHRGAFNDALKNLGLAEKSAPILRAVDKLGKAGKDEVRQDLLEITADEGAVTKLLSFIEKKSTNEETLDRIEALAGTDSPGVIRLRELLALIHAVYGEDSCFVLDPSITRGLDYYTGIVYETFLTALPALGSVCSGGRYDNLAGLYTKQRIPGVGSSIGLDRLLAGLEQLGKLPPPQGGIDVEIFCAQAGLFTEAHRIAEALRQRGADAEVFPDVKKPAQQYAFAEKKGVPFGVFLAGEGASAGSFTLKDLSTREQFEVDAETAATIILNKRKFYG